MADGIEAPGLSRFRADLRDAASAAADLHDSHEAVASLVGRAALGSAPRGRTGQTAASVRFGATTEGAEVTVTAPNAIPTHWGAPRINQRGNPWVARAWAASEPEVVNIYETGLDHIIDTID